jgi:hypothetical protein
MPLLNDDDCLSTLEPGQFSEAKRAHVPRRHLKRWEVVLFWFLRIYVLFMLAVVVYQASRK